MSDVFVFYDNRSLRNVLNKDLRELTGSGSVSVNFKGAYDIDAPELILNYNNVIEGQANYCHAVSSNMYYFVDKPVLEPGGRMRVKMHLDPLMSFKNWILESNIVVDRNEVESYAYLDDPVLPVEKREMRAQFIFPKEPLKKSQEFILITAGGAG